MPLTVTPCCSDPLASVQARLSAPRQPQRHPRMEHIYTTPAGSMLQPRPLAAASQMSYAQPGPPGLQQNSIQQPWGPPPPHPPQSQQPPVHFQPAGHAPMRNDPGAPFPGRGAQQYHSWQAPVRGPPLPQGAPFARPPGPQPPAAPPPGIRPAGVGTSGQGRGRPGQGRGRPGQGRGPARGRGQGRTSGGAGGHDNIEAYVSQAMLQDPWAVLMKQYQLAAAAEQRKPPVEDEGTSTTPAAAGQSISDVFDAVEQEAQELNQGRLTEEGRQDRPWH
ncbi:hypothetical protein ABBQ32_006196 [Trebouxia sp. C0010 RCD-2024]